MLDSHTANRILEPHPVDSGLDMTIASAASESMRSSMRLQEKNRTLPCAYVCSGLLTTDSRKHIKFGGVAGARFSGKYDDPKIASDNR